MRELDDIALLQLYSEQNSEAAFSTLVTRHIDRVYSVALRLTRNPHQAEEITQAVFVILARKSGHLNQHVILEGWLYETARLTSLTFIRGEIRRTRRDHEAYMQNILNEKEADVWTEIAPVLDSGLAGLNETDRHAIVLRFFYGKSLKEIGTALGGSEDTARMRVNRALEKMRKFFSKRGIASTTATLAGVISAHSVQAAPVTLAKTVIAVAIAKDAAASGSMLTLIKGALKVMAWSKAKTAVVIGAGILLAAGTTTVTIKAIQAHGPQAWQKGFNMSVLDEAPPQATILRALPARDPEINGWRGRPGDGKFMGLNVSVTDIVCAAYNVTRARIIFSTPAPEGRYDFISNVPKNQREALQQATKKEFGLVGQYALIETNILELTVRHPAVGLKQTSSAAPEFSGANGFIWLSNQPVADLTYFGEYFLGTPVVNRNRLTGYYDLKWDFTTDGFKKVVGDDLGLEFVPGNDRVAFLVMEKTK